MVALAAALVLCLVCSLGVLYQNRTVTLLAVYYRGWPVLGVEGRLFLCESRESRTRYLKQGDIVGLCAWERKHDPPFWEGGNSMCAVNFQGNALCLIDDISIFIVIEQPNLCTSNVID